MSPVASCHFCEISTPVCRGRETRDTGAGRNREVAYPPRDPTIGKVESIAFRLGKGSDMCEARRRRVICGAGLEGEDRGKGARGVTLLSVEKWNDVLRALDVDLLWHVRRANLLVSGIDLASTIGGVLRIGVVRLRVHGETKPCGLMDDAHSGLRNALATDFRGGVHAEVLGGGTICVGDEIVADQ